MTTVSEMLRDLEADDEIARVTATNPPTTYNEDSWLRDRERLRVVTDGLQAIIESASDGREVPEWLTERIEAILSRLGETK